MNNRNKLQIIYRKNLIKAYGGFCWFCYKVFNNTSKVQFHHIKNTNLNGRGRGRKERYYDILNNPNCYVPLCPRCHKLIESSENNFFDFL